MLLYILSSLISLISLSSSDIECGYVTWSMLSGEYSGYPLGVCGVISNIDNYKYVCDGNGPIVKELHYDTTDCSGEPSYTFDNFCDTLVNSNYCGTKCSTNLCNNFITETYYKSSDCSGNDITTRNIYLKDTCLGNLGEFPRSDYYSCNGKEIQYYSYSNNGDCSGNNTQPENIYNTSCISKSDGTSYKWDGCDDNDDNCSRFKLFIAIIIVFIHIIHT